MSMLSAQCDELRKAAQTYRTLGRYETEQTLLDAADTIIELRDDLQRADDAVRDAEHDESRAWDRVRKAESENAKLRELAREMHATISRYNSWWDYACKDTRRFADELRELGVEVG